MTHIRFFLLAGLSALAITVARQAHADVYYVTYTGTVSGTDTNGLFGSAGAVLSSAAFTSTYTYDPSQFGNAHYVNTTSGGITVGSEVSGGSYNGTTDPLLSASITVNGSQLNQFSSYSGLEQLYGPSNYIMSSAFGSSSNYLTQSGSVLGLLDPFLTTSQSFGMRGTGSLAFNGDYLTLTDAYVTITDGPPAAVPEPTSLALLAGAAGVFAAAFGARWTMPRPFA